MKSITFFVLFLVIAITQFTLAQIPQTMSYQGVLTGTDGTPVADGMVSLTFRLYDSSENGDTLWQEIQNVQVTNGIFNVILGSINPLNLPFDKQYWLGVTISGETELNPRVTLTASPYSLNSHSTIAETQPGQGLTIRNSSGDPTHQFDANGDVKHTGTGTFLGGIVAGDSTIVPPIDTLMSITGTNTELIKRNLNYRAEKYQQIRGVVGKGSKLGVYGYSPIGIGVEGESGDGEGVLGQSYSSSGVIGKSHFGVGVSGSSGLYTGVLGTGSLGVWGSSYDSIGVLGESRDYVGVVGKGQIAGVWSKGKLKVDNVPSAPNQERFLVWDADNYVKYRTMQPSGGSFNGTLDDKPLILKDASGDTVFSVMTDGKSVHKGEETFLDGIKLTDANNGPGMFILQRSIILFDKNGGAGGTLDGDRGLISFKPVEVRDTLRVKDAQGNVVTMFAPDGTSLHKGDETFEGDVILKGKGIKLVDGNGTTLGGFGRTDLDTGQRLGVYGKAEQSGDLAGAFDGNVDVRGEITTNSLHIVDANGDTLTSFNNDGTSIHTGLETYKAGIKTTLNNGNILRIDPAEGLTIKTPTGQFIAHIRYDGAAYFAGNVSKGGGSFKIDHPLDPEHKFLYHSFVESPDMMNVYNGNVTLNNSGEALVKLPDWFEALNKDFKYQLTAIGAPGPNLYIAEKVSGNRFKIAGGTEGMEVSWQITGIRKDAYAEKHRIPVEELKKGDEIGHYLHPDAFGLPENMGITTSGESSRLTNNDLNKR